MHNKGNKGKSIIAERFIRTLMNKIYKYMTLLAKNVYVNNLADIVKKYNNTYHNTIKMKPVNVKISTYIDFGIENNEKDPKFKVGDHVRISKYKNIFAECYTQNWSEEVFVIKKKLKILFRGHMLLVILKVNESLERFTKKNRKKQVKKSLGLKK